MGQSPNPKWGNLGAPGGRIKVSEKEPFFSKWGKLQREDVGPKGKAEILFWEFERKSWGKRGGKQIGGFAVRRPIFRGRIYGSFVALKGGGQSKGVCIMGGWGNHISGVGQQHI